MSAELPITSWITTNTEFPEFKDVRVYGTQKDPLFLARDLAEVLEIKQISCARSFTLGEDYVKIKAYNVDNVKQEMNAFTFAGVCRVLMKSTSPSAKRFQRFVIIILQKLAESGAVTTSEVLQELTIREARIAAAERERIDQEEFARLGQITVTNDVFPDKLRPRTDMSQTIYIATTERYAAECIYKVGYTCDITARTVGFNTSRHNGDTMRIIRSWPVFDGKIVETMAHSALAQYKHGREFFCIGSTALEKIVAESVRAYNGLIERANEWVDHENSWRAELDYEGANMGLTIDE